MLKIIKLLLPALLPAWNFFDIIAPSPRIQYELLDSHPVRALISGRNSDPSQTATDRAVIRTTFLLVANLGNDHSPIVCTLNELDFITAISVRAAP